METRHFQKVVFRMNLFLSLQSFTCHKVNIRVWKYLFTRAIIKNKVFPSFLTRVVCVALMSHSFRSCSTRVALVSHSCCLCLTCVAFVLLVPQPCCIRIAHEKLQCKNKKLHKLISNKQSNKKEDSYSVPVINLSCEDLDTKPLKYSLHLRFTGKNKYIKRIIAVELESLAMSLDKFVGQSVK